MTWQEMITDALSGTGLPVAEQLYEGKADEFITFNLADNPAEDFGDNDALSLVYYVQVHYVCRWEADYTTKVKQIRKALYGAGFTYPDLTDLSDRGERIRHLVFECSIENNFDLEEEDEKDEVEDEEEEESEE